MTYTRTSFELRGTEQTMRAQMCRTLATKADEQAAQSIDPEMRATFLSMKELWLKLANEIDRRQAPTHAA